MGQSVINEPFPNVAAQRRGVPDDMVRLNHYNHEECNTCQYPNANQLNALTQRVHINDNINIYVYSLEMRPVSIPLRYIYMSRLLTDALGLDEQGNIQVEYCNRGTHLNLRVNPGVGIWRGCTERNVKHLVRFLDFRHGKEPLSVVKPLVGDNLTAIFGHQFYDYFMNQVVNPAYKSAALARLYPRPPQRLQMDPEKDSLANIYDMLLIANFFDVDDLILVCTVQLALYARVVDPKDVKRLFRRRTPTQEQYRNARQNNNKLVQLATAAMNRIIAQ